MTEKQIDPILNFRKALIATQAQLAFVAKDAEGHKYHYATHAQIMKAIGPVLEKNNLLIFHETKDTDGKLWLSTTLAHVEGGSISTKTPLLMPIKQDMQSLGSAKTYAKRYNIIELLNLAIVDKSDDDGASIVDKISDEEVQELRDVVNRDASLISSLRKRFGIMKLEDLPSSRLSECMQIIKEYKEANNG